MNYNVEKILYLGAGLHLDPVMHFPNVKEFVFIDTLPRNEFDLPNKLHTNHYKEQFITKLVTKFVDSSFTAVDVETLDDTYANTLMNCKQKIYYKFHRLPEFILPTLITFVNHNTSQLVKYYVSTNILYNMTYILKQDINTSDAVIVKDYSPDMSLLSYFDKQKIFIGYNTGYYGIDINKKSRDPNDIIYFLHHGYIGSVASYFKCFCYYSEYAENSENICVFNTFQDFYDYHISMLNKTITNPKKLL